jgi:hypothetical protein
MRVVDIQSGAAILADLDERGKIDDVPAHGEDSVHDHELTLVFGYLF